jgi:hypothetical protein
MRIVLAAKFCISCSSMVWHAVAIDDRPAGWKCYTCVLSLLVFSFVCSLYVERLYHLDNDLPY